VHLAAANDRLALKVSLTPGQAGDDPQGREMIRRMKPPCKDCALVRDRAYEGNESRRLARRRGFKPVVPPHPRRQRPWNYSQWLYKRRNVMERLIRHLTAFRAALTHFDKLDALYLGGLYLVLDFICVNMP
jgi:transposase